MNAITLVAAVFGMADLLLGCATAAQRQLEGMVADNRTAIQNFKACVAAIYNLTVAAAFGLVLAACAPMVSEADIAATHCGGGPGSLGGGPGIETTIRCGTIAADSSVADELPLQGRESSYLAPSTAEEIPLRRKGSSYLVPVAVNGLPPMDFLLDTGSSVVALPAEIVFTLWRIGSLQSSDFIGNRVYVLADGRELPSLTFKIRELRVGQHVIRDAVGSLNPLGTHPLLGGSFLSRFASWTIDNQRGALVLSH
jgi:predicted aspartyl protease